MRLVLIILIFAVKLLAFEDKSLLIQYENVDNKLYSEDNHRLELRLDHLIISHHNFNRNFNGPEDINSLTGLKYLDKYKGINYFVQFEFGDNTFKANQKISLQAEWNLNKAIVAGLHYSHFDFENIDSSLYRMFLYYYFKNHYLYSYYDYSVNSQNNTTDSSTIGINLNIYNDLHFNYAYTTGDEFIDAVNTINLNTHSFKLELKNNEVEPFLYFRNNNNKKVKENAYGLGVKWNF